MSANVVFASIASPEILIVAGVIVLLFGGSQLPKLARSFGEAKKEFEKSQGDDKQDENNTDSTPKATPPAAPSPEADRGPNADPR